MMMDNLATYRFWVESYFTPEFWEHHWVVLYHVVSLLQVRWRLFYFSPRVLGYSYVGAFKFRDVDYELLFIPSIGYFLWRHRCLSSEEFSHITSLITCFSPFSFCDSSNVGSGFVLQGFLHILIFFVFLPLCSPFPVMSLTIFQSFYKFLIWVVIFLWPRKYFLFIEPFIYHLVLT